MDGKRKAEVGDLIIQTEEGQKHQGVVYKIIFNKYHHGNAFVRWVTTPPRYSEEYGISLTNIHNLRKKFDLIKVKE